MCLGFLPVGLCTSLFCCFKNTPSRVSQNVCSLCFCVRLCVWVQKRYSKNSNHSPVIICLCLSFIAFRSLALFPLCVSSRFRPLIIHSTFPSVHLKPLSFASSCFLTQNKSDSPTHKCNPLSGQRQKYSLMNIKSIKTGDTYICLGLVVFSAQ